MKERDFDKKHLIKKSNNLEVILNLTQRWIEVYTDNVLTRVILSTKTAEEFIKNI